MSIEVLDGEYPASFWAEAHADHLIQAAILHGALDWQLHHERWGVVLELAFSNEAEWERFRADPAVDAALDAVPNPASGLLIYRGRGGTSWTRQPRRPRPLAGAGAAALPLPLFEEVVPEPLAPPRVLVAR
jgi:hypothetical protein